MFMLDHRVRVFVYHFLGSDPRYLLLRQKPRAEWPLGPVIGVVGVDEHLEDTVVREVAAETGLCRAEQIVDLSEPTKDLFGEVGLVEWPFAFHVASSGDRPIELVPGPMVGEWAWMGFEEAFQSIESRRDRDALVRLRLRLAG
ncbi:MAG: NUDIX hydrolase [Planctomycetota bacterium]